MTGQGEEKGGPAEQKYDEAISLRVEGRYEEARAAFRQALDLYRDVPGSERERAVCLFNTGFILHGAGRYEEALSAYRRAVGLFRQVEGDEEGITKIGRASCRERV